MAMISDFPGIDQYLDKTDDYENSVSEVNLNGARLLIVTQKGEIDGGQLVFQFDGEDLSLVNRSPWGLRSDGDTFVDLSGNERNTAFTALRRQCGASSDQDHSKVYSYMESQVGEFSSANGPDSGNLACVWAVRHIVRRALGRWVTQVDGTAVFDTELRRCFGSTSEEAETPAGGIIISPTGRNIGHVGLLGPGNGSQRKVYSNSSRYAEWRQNFTVGTWLARYRDTKGLPVRFFPLPLLS